MRGAAALMVVIFHMGFWFPQAIFPKAYLAVDLFFCLSGFVIAHAYSGKLSSGMKVSEFIALRIARLYPLYILGTLLGFFRLAGQIFVNHPNAPSPFAFFASIILSFFMLPSWSPRFDLYPANTVAWSLVFELLVNAAYAFCFPFLTTRRMIQIAVVSGAGLLLFGTLNGDFEMGPFWSDFVGTCFRTVFSFSMGLIVYRFRDDCPLKVPAPALLILVVAALAVPFHGAVWYDAIFCAVISPILVWCGAGAGTESAKHKVSSFLGYVSYPIYMIHTPFVSAVGNFKYKFDFNIYALAILIIIFIVILSYLVGKFYDEPMRRRLLMWVRGAFVSQERMSL